MAGEEVIGKGKISVVFLKNWQFWFKEGSESVSAWYLHPEIDIRIDLKENKQ